MISSACVFLATALMIASDDAPTPAIQKDRQSLAGVWIMTDLQVEGEKVEVPNQRATFDAEGKVRVAEDGKPVRAGTTTIDPTKSPKTIDFEVTEGERKGDKYKGIYEVTDDTLKICRCLADGGERPTEFSTKSGFVMATYKREKK